MIELEKRRVRVNKEEIYNFLKSKNIQYEVTEHKACINMAEIAEVELPYPEADAKIFLYVMIKRGKYYLITVKGDKRVDLKEFKQKYNTRSLSFASENDLMNIMNLPAGSVTPLGLLNDNECKVQFCIDKDFFNESELIGVHPNDNTATVWLKTKDLINIIKEQGNIVHIVEL